MKPNTLPNNLPSEKIKDKLRANPFDNQPLNASTLDLAVNRKQELAKLERALLDASQGIRQNYALLGEDGTGKTSLLNMIQARGELVPNLLVIRLEITSDTTELRFFKTLTYEIIGALEKVTGSIAPLIVGNDVKAIKRRIEGIVREESTQTQVALSIGTLFGFLGFSGGMAASSRAVTTRFEDVSEISPALQKVVDAILSKKYTSIVVMIDEAGYIASQTTKSLLQQLRFMFQRPPFMLVIAGNPVLIEDLIMVERTFGNLIPPNLRVSLQGFGLEDVRKFIAVRLLKVRNDQGRHTQSVPTVGFRESPALEELDPFSFDSADEIFRQSRGNPRDTVLISHEAMESALLKDKQNVDVGDVIEAAKIVLAGRGRDIFAILTDREKEIAMELSKSGDDYAASLAKKFNKERVTVTEQLKRMLELGYIQVSRKGGSEIYYRPSRPLQEYLTSSGFF